MKIRFIIPYRTAFGEQLFIYGSLPELGEWEISRARGMIYRPDGVWESELEIPATGRIEFGYRYFIKNGRGEISWEGGAPRIFSLSARERPERLELRDLWRSPSDPDALFLTSAFSDVIFRRESESRAPGPDIQARSKALTVRLQVVAPRVGKDHGLCVVGSIPALGGWDTAEALSMNSASFPLWTADIRIRGDELPFRYKYIIRNESGGVVMYEKGDDRVLSPLDGTAPSKTGIIIATDCSPRYHSPWRGAGIAVPVFSLRSRESLGVGEFLDMKPLVDWACLFGFQLIQILPVNDTTASLDQGDSNPYAGISVFALHPLYLNIQAMGALPQGALREIESAKKTLNSSGRVEYRNVMALKMRLVREIFRTRKKEFLLSPDFCRFLSDNSHWLKPYAAFCALRDFHGTNDHLRWGEHSRVSPDGIDSLTSPDSPHHDAVALYYFIQYHLHLQLAEVSRYASERGVVLKGDIPIGIRKRSDSCWFQPELFHINRSAGAPPDPFSDAGQNWNFPTYNWEEMARDNYSWWRSRLSLMSRYFQMVRLDHVLGFFRIWEIPDSQISSLMGFFNPALPLTEEELNSLGIGNLDRLSTPYITREHLEELFGESADDVESEYLEKGAGGRYRLKKQFDTQRKVQEYIGSKKEERGTDSGKISRLRSGLFTLISNVILLKDPDGGGYHPRINMMNTRSFALLDEKEKLKDIYYDFFYRRHEEFWRARAMKLLPMIKGASRMLVCGEDLGMVPDCVPGTLQDLCILGLRIQRMPKETDREFGRPRDYPYLTVASTSSHDMSTLRGWWEEDRARTQRFYRTVLMREDDAPLKCEPRVCEEIVRQHLNSPSMWAIFPIQDILDMSPTLRSPGDPGDDRINTPGSAYHQWSYRIHIPIEELLSDREFIHHLRGMLEAGGRCGLY